MQKIKLQESTYSNAEIMEVMDSLLSTNVVMGAKTKRFENLFEIKYNAKYVTMVNSGSSANLLLANLLTSRRGKYRLKPNDEILVPSVTWCTTLFPIMQMGLRPVLTDVDLYTLNIDLNSAKRCLTKKTKALFYVPLLGNTHEFDKVLQFCEDNKLLLLIDACEATGAKFEGKNICEYGIGTTFSFMFAHHISTIEGGMVVVNNEEDNQIIKMLRSHGWARNLSEKEQKKLQKEYKIKDMQFAFFDIAYNIRPTEINAAMGIHQLDRIDKFIEIRKLNYLKYVTLLKDDILNKAFTVQIYGHDKYKNTESSPFAFAIILNPSVFSENAKSELQIYLTDNGIENRSIVAGNLANQPFFNLYYDKISCDSELKNADIIDKYGIYLPLHQAITSENIMYICHKIRKFVK